MDGGTTLIISILVGLVGAALLLYGRRQSRLPHVGIGLLMCLTPFVPASGYVVGGIAAGLAVLLVIGVKLGL